MPWKYFYALQPMGRPSIMLVQRVPQATTSTRAREGQVRHRKPRHVLDSYAPLGNFVVPCPEDDVDAAREQARHVMARTRKRNSLDLCSAFDVQQSTDQPTILHPRKKRA